MLVGVDTTGESVVVDTSEEDVRSEEKIVVDVEENDEVVVVVDEVVDEDEEVVSSVEVVAEVVVVLMSFFMDTESEVESVLQTSMSMNGYRLEQVNSPCCTCYSPGGGRTVRK